MTKDEIKNKISMALKDPILQQGFEIICKNLADLEKENAELSMKRKAERKIFQGIVEKKNDQLTKAKELIENVIRVTWGEGWNYSLDWKVKAKQFLNSEVKK